MNEELLTKILEQLTRIADALDGTKFDVPPVADSLDTISANLENVMFDSGDGLAAIGVTKV